MNINRDNNQSSLTEEEIDLIVEQQANDDSAWEPPIQVDKKMTSVSIPSKLATKAVFFASLHRETNLEAWLLRVIQERLELEEAALREIKDDIARNSSKTSGSVNDG
jgi:hypothetical protein